MSVVWLHKLYQTMNVTAAGQFEKKNNTNSVVWKETIRTVHKLDVNLKPDRPWCRH